MAKKKTTKKTATRKPAKKTTPAPKPRLVPQPTPPPARTKTLDPAVPVEDYIHMQARFDTFIEQHPGAVYFRLPLASREENERALASLSDDTPVIVCTSRKPGMFTALDLNNLGFMCFQNGKGGQLVGTKVK